MIAVTKIKTPGSGRDDRLLQVEDCEILSGFGSDVTYVVGSGATQINGKGPGSRFRSSSQSSESSPSGLTSILRTGARFGPFRLLKRLGQGAQGDVWKAKRLEPFAEVVALKVLNPSLATQPHRLSQFRREAERGARLAGPSLLPVFELGKIDSFLYMAMPFVEGTTLQQLIKGRRNFLRGEKVELVHRLVATDEENYLRNSVRIMAKAARGLHFVHKGRVAHRDIKPANILLDYHRPHAVYLCDLGLGRDLEVATQEQMRDGAGTPMYMAPERLLKAPADEILCDIYSLGATLFETFTLARPFEAPDGIPLQCLAAFLARAEPRKPRDIQPSLPMDLELIIIKAMSRDPGQRYRTAQEIAVDLDSFLVRWSFRTGRLHVDEGCPNSLAPHVMRKPPRSTPV